MSERTIWKFTIAVSAITATWTTILHIPERARFLHCAEQHGQIALWYEVPFPDAPKAQHGFQLVGTGTSPIRDGLTYVGTTSHAGGDLILHIYETDRM